MKDRIKDIVVMIMKLNTAKNAVIYCDIPYENTTSYQSCKNFNHNQFWDWCRDISKDNIVLISELNAPDDFVCIWAQDVLRSLNSKNKNKAVEKLFIHKSCINNV